MCPTLIALAGPSRSGKGTAADIFRDEVLEMGLDVHERQLSGPGKQYVASAFNPEITEQEAIQWFEGLKVLDRTRVAVQNLVRGPVGLMSNLQAEVSLQQYLQRMLQGARDRWGIDFWTDKLLPAVDHWGREVPDSPPWWDSFRMNGTVADLCLVSDLRQESEAERVKALGGWIIEFRRPPIDHAYITGSDHVTEQRLSDIRPDLVDYVIEGAAEHNDETFAVHKERCRACWTDFVRPRLEHS